MKIFTFIDSLGNEIEMVEIEISEGHFTQMTKATYDAQQEALANGNNI